MYSPKYAVQNDPRENELIIETYPFATVVCGSECFHLPLILEGNRLIGHMARANPAWASLAGAKALFIFHGPHHYISPTFYGTENNVPTWNYISVHVKGLVHIREDEAFLKRALLLLSQKEDPAFPIEKNISENQKLLGSIVGLDIEIGEIFGKFKLAQSKPESERQNVIAKLEEIGSDQAKETAAAMKKTISR